MLFQQNSCTEVVNALLYLPSGQIFHQILNKFPRQLTPLNLHQISDKNHLMQEIIITLFAFTYTSFCVWSNFILLIASQSTCFHLIMFL